jgi:ELWxxDGT repeat protein
MNSKAGIFLSLVPVCLGLLPAAAAAQDSVGPLELFSGGGTVTSWAQAGSLAYFTTVAPTSAYPPQYTTGFIRSDGTWQGTHSIDPRGPASSPQSQASIRFADSLGQLVFFTCAKNSALEDRGLWRSDGTAAGTFSVTQGLSIALDIGGVPESPVDQSVPARNLMFFSAGPRSGSPDYELWATDGTPEGTRLVKDVNPEGASNPRRMIELAGRLYFLADTPLGREVWRSDGTEAGTERILDLHEPGPGISLDQAGGALFILVDSESGLEVWRSDGTVAGTTRVLDLPLRLRGGRAAGRHLFLVARDAAQNNEMWAFDGGTGEAVRVLQVETSQEIQLLAVGDHVAFTLEDDQGQEPWWSDGTPEGTRRIADICSGPCSSSSRFYGVYRGRAVFGATDGVSGYEPWLTDGTAAGTFRLGDFCPGECDSFVTPVQEINGWLVLQNPDGSIWISDGTRDGAWTVGSLQDARVLSVAFPNRLLFASFQTVYPFGLMLFETLPVTAPAPPPGHWMTSPRVPGFRFKVQIGQIMGRQESACVVRTLCVSGAVGGRPEVFLRVSDPKPDGRRWPSLVKLTTSAVDVWVVQTATGHLRHYRLPGSTGAALPGFLDREGFLSAPAADAPSVAVEEAIVQEAGAASDPKPPGAWLDSKEVPGFRVQARITANGQKQTLRKEPCTIAETFCLRGAPPGLTELLVRVTGPKPNQYYWPMLARFAPATLEVWIQQKKTKKIRYYRLNPPPADSSQLDGYFDRLGFKR